MDGQTAIGLPRLTIDTNLWYTPLRCSAHGCTVVDVQVMEPKGFGPFAFFLKPGGSHAGSNLWGG